MVCRVFAWGANSHGQLGVGFNSELITNPVLVPFPLDGPIDLISGGGGHTLICCKGKRLFSCGWNNKGQLGLGDLIDRSSFEEIALDLAGDERICQIACGWDTSAVLTTNCRLFVFGGNQFNQLGFKNTKIIMSPVELQLPNGDLPLQVALSMRQIVIKSQSQLFISGKSKAIEKIRANPSYQEDPGSPLLKYKPYSEPHDIAAGQHHVIYSSGRTIRGIGENKFRQSEDQEFPEKVLQICSGWTHNGCLLSTGEAYLWGRNCYGQLGTGKATDSELEATKLNIPEKIKEIHLGSEHGLALDQIGNIYTWGWNEHGNCGNGSEENVLKPERININEEKAIKSCCGDGFCFVVTESAKV